MQNGEWDKRSGQVALLTEGVDRNKQYTSLVAWYKVALLAEGVDRNVGMNPEITLREHRRPPRGGRG